MKTYALLVGLDQYQDKRIPALHGCVNDVTRFETYLKTKLRIPDAYVLKLTNSQATKIAVATAFQKHLAKATKEDTVIFYFAGHGIKQHANAVFKTDVLNDTFECMTCYDTTLTGGNLIADKELRWLISELAKKTDNSHILTIFDCCHSGDNTREIEQTTLNERFVRDMNDRGKAFIMPERPWKDFIFSKTITENDVKINDLETILPQGAHIQLAACASNETAKEKEGRGLFSKYLLELLETSGGKISYYDLRALTYRRLSSFPPENRQTPQFYAVKDSLFQKFLGGEGETEVQADVSFSTDRNQWEMSMGDIYGITQGAEVFVTLPHKNNQTEAAVVEQVFQDYSVLSFDIEKFEAKLKPEDKRVRRTDSYKCSVGKFIQKEIKVACASKTAAAAWTEYAKSRAEMLENARIKPVDITEKPDYVLNTEGGYLFIADPKYSTRALVKVADFSIPNKAFDTVTTQLKQATRWDFVKSQKSNPDADSLFDSIKISFDHEGKSDDIKKTPKIVGRIRKYKTNEVNELYTWDEPLSIKITNNHPTDSVYISGMWLSEFFGVDCTILNQNSIAAPLDAGKTVYVYAKSFRLSFRDHIFQDRWDKFYNYLKIYVSNSPFEITQFQQADLESPSKKPLRGEEIEKRGAIPIPEETHSSPQWAVKTIEIELDTSGLFK